MENNKQDVTMECKDCPYYSGVQCHGHGEYWGECNFYLQLIKMHETILKFKGHDIVFAKGTKGCYLGDNSRCQFAEYCEYKD